MIKKALFLALFILIFVSVFSLNYFNETMLIINPVSKDCENLSFEYFGTRSMSLQIKDMSKLGTDRFVFLIKGWIFKPNINEDINKEAVLEIEFSDAYITKSISITETNLYYNIEPHIVISSKNIERIKLFNIEIHGSEFLPIKQLFDVISIKNAATRIAGINALNVVDSKAEITEEVSANDNLFFLISAGEKPTGGYSLKVNEVYKKGREFIVKAELDAPSESDFVTQAFTYPQKTIKLGKYNTGQYEATLELTVSKDVEKTVKFYTVTFLVKDVIN
ncbi:MAG: protease complex subunit PrcB family protein [Thermotogota bacterium]|nr:protease complex subunit PrcB family protein [Thermotogota bacterium]